MKDSRKGKRDGEKELSMPNPHVDGEKGKIVIVYNTKEGERKEDWKYSQIIALGHVRRYYLYRLRVQFFLFNAIIQALGSRFRLAFSPALYKFIVWATWA